MRGLCISFFAGRREKNNDKIALYKMEWPLAMLLYTQKLLCRKSLCRVQVSEAVPIVGEMTCTTRVAEEIPRRTQFRFRGRARTTAGFIAFPYTAQGAAATSQDRSSERNQCTQEPVKMHARCWVPLSVPRIFPTAG
jgi:hypothetical protein